MTCEEAREKAEANFLEGYNCTQAVLCTFCEQLGFDKETALKMAQPLGGGFSRLREVCGTVSGMFLVAGFIAGSADPKDKDAKDRVYKISRELAEKFRQEHGSIICRELLGLVPMGQSQKAAEDGTAINRVEQESTSQERTAEYYKKRPCPKLAGDAAVIIQEYINSLES